MTVKEFNDKYKADYGGIVQLTEMRALMLPLEQIATYFGVTKERVRQWMEEFFGLPYDPRPLRRREIVSSMVDFARNNTLDEFSRAYSGTDYYGEAYDRAVDLDIYAKN